MVVVTFCFVVLRCWCVVNTRCYCCCCYVAVVVVTLLLVVILRCYVVVTLVVALLFCPGLRVLVITGCCCPLFC